MDIFALVLLGVAGGLIGAIFGMAFATVFEHDKKYGKAVLTYLVCIIATSLVFVVPVIIVCL